MSWSTSEANDRNMTRSIKNIVSEPELITRLRMALGYIANASAFYGSEPKCSSYQSTLAMAALYPQDYL